MYNNAPQFRCMGLDYRGWGLHVTFTFDTVTLTPARGGHGRLEARWLGGGDERRRRRRRKRRRRKRETEGDEKGIKRLEREEGRMNQVIGEDSRINVRKQGKRRRRRREEEKAPWQPLPWKGLSGPRGKIELRHVA